MAVAGDPTLGKRLRYLGTMTQLPQLSSHTRKIMHYVILLLEWIMFITDCAAAFFLIKNFFNIFLLNFNMAVLMVVINF